MSDHESLNRKRRIEMTDKCDVVTSAQIDSTDERLRRVLLIALCVISALLGRLCFLARPFDSDGAIFIYQGKLVSEGGRYVHEFIDNKFPTVGLMTSFFWWIWGAWWPGYVLSGAFMSVIACGLIARSARRNFGIHATMPALLMAIVCLNFTFAVYGGFQLETIQVLFTTIAGMAALNCFCARGRLLDALLAGLGAGCAAMIKPTGLAVFCAFAFVSTSCFAREPRHLVRLLAAATCGLAIPLLVSLTYLIAADNVRDLPAIYAQIRAYAANSAWRWDDSLKPLIVLGILAFPLIVRGGVFRRERDRAETGANRFQIVFLLSWLALELVGVVAQRRMYAYHFLVLAPPAALLFAALPRRDRMIPIAAALVLMTLFSIYGAAKTIESSAATPQRLAVSDYLASHATPNDRVWQDSYSRLLIETGLRPGSRVPLTFLFANSDSAPMDYACLILDDFKSLGPEYIILPADLDAFVQWHTHNIAELEQFPGRRANYITAWQQIRAYVSANYVAQAKVGNDQVWRRLAPAERQAAAR